MHPKKLLISLLYRISWTRVLAHSILSPFLEVPQLPAFLHVPTPALGFFHFRQKRIAENMAKMPQLIEEMRVSGPSEDSNNLMPRVHCSVV